jgi:hypothetical protein
MLDYRLLGRSQHSSAYFLRGPLATDGQIDSAIDELKHGLETDLEALRKEAKEKLKSCGR